MISELSSVAIIRKSHSVWRHFFFLLYSAAYLHARANRTQTEVMLDNSVYRYAYTAQKVQVAETTAFHRPDVLLKKYKIKIYM